MILLKNNYSEEDEKLFSTGDSELDDILEEVYYSGISDGYDYFQKEFGNKENKIKKNKWIKELGKKFETEGPYIENASRKYGEAEGKLLGRYEGKRDLLNKLKDKMSHDEHYNELIKAVEKRRGGSENLLRNWYRGGDRMHIGRERLHEIQARESGLNRSINSKFEAARSMTGDVSKQFMEINKRRMEKYKSTKNPVKREAIIKELSSLPHEQGHNPKISVSEVKKDLSNVFKKYGKKSSSVGHELKQGIQGISNGYKKGIELSRKTASAAIQKIKKIGKKLIK